MAKAELPKKGDLRRNRRAPGSPKQVWSPGEFIGYGILTLIVGGWMAAVLAYATGILGVLVLIAVGVAGQVMILIGVIAKAACRWASVMSSFGRSRHVRRAGC